MPGPATLRCGGNTPCVEVRCGPRVIVLDAGTGIRGLGQSLEAEGAVSVDLLISHPHMDHLQGFPFFNLAYDPRARINIHVPPLKDFDGPEPFHRLMEAPHFPVMFDKLPAEIRFQEAHPDNRLGPVRLRTHPVNHPGGCFAFRLEYEGRSVVYQTDHEPYLRLSGASYHQEELDASLLSFLRGADLLIREAQYTAEEYEHHRGWGHGTFEDAASDALKAGVRRLALFHHDPDHDDQFLEAALGRLQAAYLSSDFEIFLAREGQCIELA
ncbi:MAG: MBL fold metallo-hydrolase [Bryobacteraceae bacterium]